MKSSEPQRAGLKAWQIVALVVIWPIGLYVLLRWVWSRSNWPNSARIGVTVASGLLLLGGWIYAVANGALAPKTGVPAASRTTEASAPVATTSPAQASTTTTAATTGPAPSSAPTALSPQELSDRSRLPRPEQATGACLAAFRELEPAKGEIDDTWTPVIVKTLTACGDVPHYLWGFRAYPDALGASDGNDFLPLDFKTICGIMASDAYGEQYPVCRDARQRGFLPTKG